SCWTASPSPVRPTTASPRSAGPSPPARGSSSSLASCRTGAPSCTGGCARSPPQCASRILSLCASLPRRGRVLPRELRRRRVELLLLPLEPRLPGPRALQVVSDVQAQPAQALRLQLDQILVLKGAPPPGGWFPWPGHRRAPVWMELTQRLMRSHSLGTAPRFSGMGALLQARAD